jgi:hypothetical protein
LSQLWANALPPLIFSGCSSSSASIPVDHEDAKFIESPDFLTDIDNLENTPIIVGYSVIWTKALRKKNGHLEWRSESDIQFYVKDVIGDVLVLAGLAEKVECVNELGIHNIRPDIWIVVTRGIPIGVIEVKKPKTTHHESVLKNSAIFGQIFDYMKRLQTFTGIRHVFGILTSYSEWIICSLESGTFSQHLGLNEEHAFSVIDFPKTPIIFSRSSSTKIEYYSDACPSPAVTLDRKIYCTPPIGSGESRLIPLLTKVLLKMYYSPMIPVKLVDDRRCYIELSENSWAWRSKSFAGLNFSNFPTAAASCLLLLYDFRGGADGRVWLACSTSGRVCVIKFYNDHWKSSDIDRECSLWNDLWNLPARTITLCSKLALIMPFVVSLAEDEVRNSSDHLAAVMLAIRNLSEKHYYHDDLSWRHVGFYQSEGTKKKKGGLTAIFFAESKEYKRNRRLQREK